MCGTYAHAPSGETATCRRLRPFIGTVDATLRAAVSIRLTSPERALPTTSRDPSGVSAAYHGSLPTGIRATGFFAFRSITSTALSPETTTYALAASGESTTPRGSLPTWIVAATLTFGGATSITVTESSPQFATTATAAF